MNETIDRTEARRRWGRAYGNWYWVRKDAGTPKAERVAHILEYRKYREIWKTAPMERNERGNEIYRDADADQKLGVRRGDCRYYYDFEALSTDDWRQWDTRNDASYWGMWVNLKARMTFTYCEGDRTLVVCEDDAHLKAELDDAVRFYGEAPPAWIAFSQDETGAWTRTEYYDTRPTVAELEAQ